ncbi:hypothetical protein ACJMK2_016080 [Sinanodonta woodiana]|uniref:BTB domain-containing protein n=1 Tax=Sinanodonta woodiana TaxID=1069815 RepID=A0ABD3UVA3_SINWO
MDLKQLFHSCRSGDLAKVKYLVEQKEVELNVRDSWDSTPLYYACLCGHENIVTYLLEKGARCEANTFDGERCLYGALDDRIRNILRSYHAVTSRVLRRDYYEEFLRRLLEGGMYEDVIFSIGGEKFPAHRCILSARCSYFAKLFHTHWKGGMEITVKNTSILPWAFRAILQYLYTGQLEVHVDYVDDCLHLARKWKLDKLITDVTEKLKKLESFESTKPGVSVTKLALEDINMQELQLAFRYLADLALPRELCAMPLGELPFEPEFLPIYADICFSVEGHRFLCHKAFFCGRSDYFKALQIDHFGESTASEGDLPVVFIHDISADIFTRVMYYIYQDSCELSKEVVYDVLCAADMYLLPGLKRLCANCISQFLDCGNVVQILRTARLFNLPRLEDQCAEFIANDLDEVIVQEEFHEIVKEDAAKVKDRQETDTIDIIDSVRFHLTNFVQTYSEMEEANEELRLIDKLLEELGLEG